MLTAVFSLAGAFVFGAADFLGGLASKRVSSLLATGVASLTGFVLLLAALPLLGGMWMPGDLIWSILAGLAGGSPGFGLYLDCCARAMPFFGVPGLEAAYLANAFEGVPLAGMLGSCEIGPIGRTHQLLTYTGVLALVDG